MRDKVLIKWNNEKNWFEAFMPDGTQIPQCSEITITDNFGKDSHIGKLTATIKLNVTFDTSND